MCFYITFWFQNVLLWSKNMQNVLTERHAEAQKSQRSMQIRLSHIWSLYDIRTCFGYPFGKISMFLRCFEAFFVFLHHFLSPKWQYNHISMGLCPEKVQNHKNHKKSSKIIYLTLVRCHYKIPVPVQTHIDVFTMLWSIFCVFTSLFESKMSFWCPKIGKMA